MKIDKVSYSDSDRNEISRWLEHIIELTILEELESSDKTNMELKTAKYLDEQIV